MKIIHSISFAFSHSRKCFEGIIEPLVKLISIAQRVKLRQCYALTDTLPQDPLCPAYLKCHHVYPSFAYSSFVVLDIFN